MNSHRILSSLTPADKAKAILRDALRGKFHKPPPEPVFQDQSDVKPIQTAPVKPDWIPDDWNKRSIFGGSYRVLDELLFRKIQSRCMHPDALVKVMEAVEFGADIHLRFSEGMDALMFALDKRFGDVDLDIVRYLLEKGADATVPNGGRTAVDFAIHSQSYDAVVMLFSDVSMHKPDVNSQDMDGITPLMRSLHYPNLEIVEFLLQQGADTEIKDYRGGNSRTHAFDSGNFNAFGILAKYAPKTGDHDDS